MNNREKSLLNKATKDLTKDDIVLLKTHFVRLYKRDVPKRVSPTFLHGNVAWGLQAEAQGDNPIRLREKLVALARQSSTTKSRDPSAGTQLIREWKGNTYVVTKTKEGFSYNNKNYRSLSIVAKHITGNHISGPKFFGLLKNEK